MVTVEPELKPFLDEMLLELSENRLEVCLVPNRDPDKPERMLRAAVSQNPEWYRELCRLYPDTRPPGKYKKKPRTIIKRRAVTRILSVMVSKGYSVSKYAEYLRDVAHSRIDIKPWNNQF